MWANGYIAHIIDGGAWTTSFTVVNSTAEASDVIISFYNDGGEALSLPVDGFGLTDTLKLRVQAYGTYSVETLGTSASTQWGWASVEGVVDTAPSISVMTVLRQRGLSRPDYEASIPLVAVGRQDLVLPFDHQEAYATIIALANPNDSTVDLSLIIRDWQGTVLQTSELSLPELGHTAFSLKEKFEQTSNTHGSVELSDPTGLSGGIVAVGLYFNPEGPFTTMPPVVGAASTPTALFQGKSLVRIEGTLQRPENSVPLTIELQVLPGSQAFFATAKSPDIQELFSIQWEATLFSYNRITPAKVIPTASRYTGPMGLLNEMITSAAVRMNFPDPQLGGSVTGDLEVLHHSE